MGGWSLAHQLLSSLAERVYPVSYVIIALLKEYACAMHPEAVYII